MGLNIPTLAEEERQSYIGAITSDECRRILDSFANGKTPVNDGLPIEFYQTFWNSIGEFMTDVFNGSFEFGSMSDTQKEAIITVIDKKDKDRDF